MASRYDQLREIERLLVQLQHSFKPIPFLSFPESQTTKASLPASPMTPIRRTLLVKIHNEDFSVSWKALDQIFSMIGYVEYIEVFGPNSAFHSKIRFRDCNSSHLALMRFNGRNIYDRCCRMEISLADEVSDNLRAPIVDLPHQEAIQDSMEGSTFNYSKGTASFSDFPIQEFEANSFPRTIDDPDVFCSSSYHLSKITVQVADSIDIETHEERCAKEVHNNKEIKAMKVLSDHDLDLSDIALDEWYEFGADSAGFAWSKSCSEKPIWHSFVLNQPFPLTDGAQEVFDEMPTRNLSFLNALDMEKSKGSVEALFSYSLPYDRGALKLECGNVSGTNFHDRPLVVHVELYCLSLLSRRVEASFEAEILGIFCARTLFVFDPGICRECKRNCLCLDVISATEKADFESSYFVFYPGGLL